MKHLFTACCLVLSLLLVSHETAFAQPKQGITFRVFWPNYDNPEPDWKDWDQVFNTGGTGAELAYNRRLDNHTWLTVPLKLGTAKFPKTARSNDAFANLDAQVQYYLFKHTRFINPALHLGIGSTWNMSAESFDFNIPAGLTLNIRLSNNLFLNAQSQYRFSLEGRPGWHHGIGATFFFDEEPPDADKDGIIDANDKCPDVPGVAATMGCPDRDSDGIADNDDKCPDTPGTAALMGCPDRDNDGIADNDDKCPDAAGTAALMGCPDRDKDGIADNDDRCPDQAGTTALKGCPDRDKDGMADPDDACPDQAGSPALKGCPDRDGDAIADKDDRCPDQAGPASNRGCPEIKAEDKAKLERAIKQVQFQTGKATLLSKSYPVLNDVADLMNKYPDYSLTISGHTDNTGDDKVNQTLSERRAKACYDYLASKGVAAARMTHAGYGETKPKASNATAAGREENRRVEFELAVK